MIAKNQSINFTNETFSQYFIKQGEETDASVLLESQYLVNNNNNRLYSLLIGR
jgi:hypothetical protein